MNRKLYHLWRAQHGECFYCGRSTWLANDHESKAMRRRRVGLDDLAPRRELRAREATLEHLERRADGGENHNHNLVMSCARCNVQRLETPVLLHLAAMREVRA